MMPKVGEVYLINQNNSGFYGFLDYEKAIVITSVDIFKEKVLYNYVAGETDYNKPFRKWELALKAGAICLATPLNEALL